MLTSAVGTEAGEQLVSNVLLDAHRLRVDLKDLSTTLKQPLQNNQD